MRTTDVRYVLAVIRSQNLRRAAATENISPPAMSEAIRRVEAELETELFVRSNRGMRMTADGRRLLSHLEAFLSAETQLKERASSTDDRRTIRVGTVLGLGVSALQSLTSRPLRLAGHRAEIEIGASGWEDVTGGIMSGISDCAILAGPTEHDTRMTSHRVGSEVLQAVMSVDHPLAKRSHLTLGDLDRSGWLSINQTGVDSRWFEYWRGDESRPGPPPASTRGPCESPNELIIALHNSEGVCMTLHGIQAQFAFGDLVLRPVHDIPPVEVRLSYLESSGSDALEELAVLLEDQMTELAHC